MADKKSFDKAQDKPYFDPIDVKVDFPALESRILEAWNKSGIVKKYLSKNKASKKKFSFLDGPITANNPMGVHHAWGRTYKDLWQRFKNLQGFRQRFQNGFDCQGLWVEVEVEKELGLKNKKDIENLVPGDKKASIAKFVELCKERVGKYAKIQTEQSKRLGYFMDWENSYFTLSDENNYMIWHFLKKCHEHGLIYKGRDSVPWCPRCGTAISQHEMLTEDYKELTHDAVYVAYPVEGKKDEGLLVWTTTPWTLLANIAVAVDPELTYVLASDGKRKYWVLDGKEKELGLKPVKKVKGEKLIGLKYISAFDNLPRVKQALGEYRHRVIPTDDRILTISAAEGTGLVHIATGAGSEDFALGKKEGLPVVAVIDEGASYLDGLGEFSGQNAKEHPEIIIDYLTPKGFIVKKEKYKHRYPACWRCKEELVWRVVDEWYIAIDPVRADMKRVARKIRWIPSFGLKRELDWLSNMHDWLISKKRYWGLALPIWECKSCGNFEVIGGKGELKGRAVEGWGKFEGKSPHRPWIDEVKISCPKCGALAERIADVGNPWLDAGIVSFSTITKDNKGEPLYWKDKGEWKKWYPADFITESFPGQFKNWFYSLISESTVLQNEEPFKTVLGFATLLGEDGRPMHKSWGNAIEFNEGADKIGVDVMRWMYVRQNPEDNLLFGYKLADETRRRFHLKLWNVYNFFVTYTNLDGWSPTQKLKVKSEKLKVIDRWILARLNQTARGVTKYLVDYNAYSASALIEEFVDDLSNWYIRRSRKRVGPSGESKEDKEVFYQTTYHILVVLMRMLSPFLPFISEIIYKNLTKEESVHLADWPQAKALGSSNLKMLDAMNHVREIVEIAHSQRKAAGIPVRQPLAKVEVYNLKFVIDDYVELLAEELNVKSGHYETGEGDLEVRLDTKITLELEEEAKTRGLIRKIQEERKRLGMGLAQRILIGSPWIPESRDNIQKIKKATLAQELQKGKFSVTKAS